MSILKKERSLKYFFTTSKVLLLKNDFNLTLLTVNKIFEIKDGSKILFNMVQLIKSLKRVLCDLLLSRK
jgi:hypothetical protein